MEDQLVRKLTQGGVKDHTVDILKQEDVTSVATFCALRHEHSDRLLHTGMTLGQHAILQQICHSLQPHNPQQPQQPKQQQQGDG